MRQARWQFQTAKAQLSELIEAALRGNPQRITRRGKGAVMVLSECAYVALKSSAKKEAPDFVTHLLAMPRQPATQRPDVRGARHARRTGVEGTRTTLALRDIEL